MNGDPIESSQAVGGAGICTLFEGDYHIGLAALVNSLCRAGYSGTVWAGYRGTLPPWIGQLAPAAESGVYFVADKIKLVFVPLVTKTHFTNYKPTFMLDLLDGRARDCNYLWYFDPDIYIRCRWPFFQEWQSHGIALCHEITNHVLPADSPLRHQWMRVASGIGLANPRPLNYYFNGGMVGVPAASKSFIETWRRILERAEAEGCDPEIFRGQGWGREMPFLGSDQDALNVAAMYSEYPLTTMGPEAMGFIPAGFTMFHSVGPKPWRRHFVLDAFAGTPPSGADKFFFTVVSSPIRVYPPLRLFQKRMGCSIGSFIGRFYARR